MNESNAHHNQSKTTNTNTTTTLVGTNNHEINKLSSGVTNKEEEIELEWEEWDGKSPFLHHCIAGSIAGVAEHTLLYPVDTVKTHMQAYCSVCPNNPANQVYNNNDHASDMQHKVKAVCTGPPSKTASSSTFSSTSATTSTSTTQSAMLSSTQSSRVSRPAHNGMWTTMLNLVHHGHGHGNSAAAVNSTSVIPSTSRQAAASRANMSLASSLPSSLSAVATLDSTLSSASTTTTTPTTTVGYARLWRGVQTMAVGCVPAHALYFSTYEALKSLLLPLSHLDGNHHSNPNNNQTNANVNTNTNLGPIGGSIAGGAATLSHDIIMTPLDTVKQRMQLGHYSGMYHAFHTIVQTEGWAGLYRSLGITVMTNLPYGMIMVVTNEFLRNYLSTCTTNPFNFIYNNSTTNSESLSPSSSSSTLNLTNTMIAGCGAGAMAAVLTSPLDRVKTRLQVQRMSAPPLHANNTHGRNATSQTATVCPKTTALQRALNSTSTINTTSSTTAAAAGTNTTTTRTTVKYLGWKDALSSIVKEEGYAGLWRGTVPRLFMHAPAVAITWTTYEAAKKWLANGY